MKNMQQKTLYKEISNYFNALRSKSRSLMQEIDAFFGKEVEPEVDDQGNGLDLKDIEYKEFFDQQDASFSKIRTMKCRGRLNNGFRCITVIKSVTFVTFCV